MGLVVSLILIAVGAILIWGVNAETTDFNVDAVGVILMIVGFVAFLLSLMMWRSWWGPGAFTSRRSTYVDAAAAAPPAATSSCGAGVNRTQRMRKRSTRST